MISHKMSKKKTTIFGHKYFDNFHAKIWIAFDIDSDLEMKKWNAIFEAILHEKLLINWKNGSCDHKMLQ